MLEFAQADKILLDLLPKLANHADKLTVCGSFRRKKKFLNDIDIVMILKSNYSFGEPTLGDTILRIDPNGPIEAKNRGKSGVSRFLNGDSIKRFYYQGVMIDIYIANPQNYSCLCLIRTGSTLHNIKLTQLAIKKGMKLFASGEGLWKVDSSGNKISQVASTEDEILQELLGKVIPPEAREV